VGGSRNREGGEVLVLSDFEFNSKYLCLKSSVKSEMCGRGSQNREWGRGRVVYCVVMEVNLDIMMCPHDTYPSRHYVGCCLYPDGLEFYRILCVITLSHIGHIGCTMSTCDDMSTK
jgi:hypothetical protein